MTVNEKGLEAALLPCPFCGCEVELVSSKNAPERLLVIACKSPSPCIGSGLGGFYILESQREEGIAAWNRRAKEAEPVAWQYRYWYSSGEPGVWLSERRKDADDLLESGVLIREETRALFTFQPDALVHVDGVTMTPAAAANRLSELQARIETLERDLALRDDLLIKAETLRFSPSITVESRGRSLWAVCDGGMVLNNAGDWEYEPRPSSRGDDFIARTRFSFADAVTHARALSPSTNGAEK